MARKETGFSFEESLKRLAEEFVNPNAQSLSATGHDVQIGSFFEFVRDIWSLSYDNPEHFNLWHVKMLCDDVESSMSEGKYYVAILPRGHYKSTILGHAFSMWRLLTLTKDDEILYISNSDTMAKYHITEIKKAVRGNPVLRHIMKDRSANSQFTFRFGVGHRYIEITSTGLTSFKRGMHVNGGMVADDLLRDPDNPLNTNTLSKVAEQFHKDAMFVPNAGAPIVVMGTPMAPNDLLAELMEDVRFNGRRLPVYEPLPDRPDIPILAPEIRDKKWLEEQRVSRPVSFATEFLLKPYTSSIAFLNDNDIEEVENPKLLSLSNSYSHIEDLLKDEYDDKKLDCVIAGFDIGKKRNPSHLAIFKAYKDDFKITQINCSFLDGWDYTEQANFINDVTEKFGIDFAYYDNTRAELDDRDVHENWKPITMTMKIKRHLAQLLEKFVRTKNIELIQNKRQREQIVCVNNDLQAPETQMGHGDCFWSIALACMAYYDKARYGFHNLGDISEYLKITEFDSKIKRVEDMNIDDMSNLDFCPKCGLKEGWESKNQMCLICTSKKSEEDFRRIIMPMSRNSINLDYFNQ